MATRKPKLPALIMPNIKGTGATTTSVVRNSSNTGQSSTSTQSSGATGAVINTGNYTSVQGAPGTPGTGTVTTVSTAPSTNQVGETPGAWNWMDDAITNALKNWPRG